MRPQVNIRMEETPAGRALRDFQGTRGTEETPAGRALRNFQRTRGKTVGCPACETGAHATRHTVACKKRRTEYELEQQEGDAAMRSADDVGEKRRRPGDQEEPEAARRKRVGTKRPAAAEDSPHDDEKRQAPTRRIWGKRPRDSQAEEEAAADEEQVRGNASGRVELITVTGPPWFDSVANEPLDEKEVDEGMKKEKNSLDSFGTYEWIKEEDCKGCVVIPTRWLLRKRASPSRVKARIVAQQLRKSALEVEDVYAAAPIRRQRRGS